MKEYEDYIHSRTCQLLHDPTLFEIRSIAQMGEGTDDVCIKQLALCVEVRCYQRHLELLQETQNWRI